MVLDQRKYMNSFCNTYLSLQGIDLSFLCEYLLYLSVINFTPFVRVLVIKTIIGHVNMYLV